MNRSSRALGAVVVSLVLTFGQARPSAAATYYADAQGGACASSGPGTVAQPYCTIAAATAAHHLPGDTILVMPGTYREKVSIPASGAPGTPLVFRAQGAGVVVDGSDSFANPSQWVQYSGAVWRAVGVTWQPAQVFVDDVRQTPASMAADSLPVGSFTWVSGQGLYLNLGGDNPGGHQTLVGRRANGFTASGRSWVTIDGFEVTRTESRAINVQSGCADMIITRNRVTFSNSYGIEVVGGTRIVVDQNVVSKGNYHGIGLTAGSTACVVRDNESFVNADPAIRRANGVYLHNAHRNTLIGNRLHHNQDSGMFFTGGASDNASHNNRSWGNGDHGFDHVDAPGNLHTNEVAYANYKDGFSVEGNSPNTQIHNCIGVDNGLTTGEFDLWVNDSSSIGFVSDYNLFYNSTFQPPFKFVDTKYQMLSDYQAASGRDAHSVQANPMFRDGPGGDFRILPESPAVDAGSSAAPDWPEDDAAGEPRVDQSEVPDRGSGPVTYADIGAFELLDQIESDAVVRPNPLRTVGPGSKRGATLSAAEVGAASPGVGVSLSSGYPNPSHGVVEFALEFPGDTRVRWEVFDLQGRTVWSEERLLDAGRATLRWDGSNARGGRAPNGVYLVRAALGDTVISRRVVRF